MKPKTIPALPYLRCPDCGQKMMPGFPLIDPSKQENLTACPACEKPWVFDAELEPRDPPFETMAPELRGHAERMWDLARACQGKPARKR